MEAGAGLMPEWSRRGAKGSRRRGERTAFRVSWTDEYGISHERELHSKSAIDSAKEVFAVHGIVLHVEVK